MAAKDPLVASVDDVIKQWQARQATGRTATENGPSIAWKNFGNSSDSKSTDFARPKRKPITRRRRVNRDTDDFWSPDSTVTLKAKFYLATPELPFIRPHELYSCPTCLGGAPTSFENIRTGLVDLFSVPRTMSRSPLHLLFCNIRFASTRKGHSYPLHVSSPEIFDTSRFQERIQSRCRKLSSKLQNNNDGGNNLQNIISNATQMLSEMHASVSNFWLKVTCWVLLKVLNGPFRCITFHKEDVEILKRESLKPVPLIYLPLHKSHMDYMLITLLLFSNDIRVPHIAAGENLGAVFGFGYLLRRLSAFFIKRRIESNDTLDGAIYNSVLQEYVEQLLKNGQSISVFIEGTRSRTGKSLVPKPGLLSLVVNAVSEGIIPDVKIVPISCCYERIPESDGYVNEALGVSKTPESLIQFFRSTFNLLFSSFGRVHISMGKPFSMQNLIKRDKSVRNGSSIVRKGSENQLLLLSADVPYVTNSTQDVGYHAIHDCCASELVMCTSIVAFLLTYNYRNYSNLSFSFLVKSFDKMKAELDQQGRLMAFSGESNDVVTYSLRILQDQNLVILDKNNDDGHFTIKKCTVTHNVVKLHFAANQICTILAGKAILATALMSLMEIPLPELIPGKSSIRVSKQQLITKCKWLAILLNREFILCPPCTSLGAYFEKIVDNFQSREILQSLQEASDLRPSQRKHAEGFDWDEDWEEPDTIVQRDTSLEVNVTSTNIEKLLLFKSALSPLLESYHVVSQALVECTQKNKELEFPECDFQKKVYEFAEDENRKYVACRSRIALKNAISVLLDVGVLESVITPSNPNTKPKSRSLKLTTVFRHGNTVNSLCDAIGSFQ